MSINPPRIPPTAPMAPPVHRGSMRQQPWLGLRRGLMFALWPGCRFPSQAASQASPWLRAAQARRQVLIGLALGVGAASLALQWGGAPDDQAPAWWLQTLISTLLFAWLGTGLATALMGAWVAWRGDPHALRLPDPHAPIHAGARTALVMPICNEDVTTVFAGLGATCASLAATGASRLFDVYVLSDTADPALRAAEMRAWQALREQLGDADPDAPHRVFYRWRRRRTRRKAGNVADFCRRWGRDYRYMVVLDADSTMQGDTLLALVRLMEAHPRAGIIQTLPQSAGGDTLHARMQQFAGRVTGRLFALGMAYWQLGESHYWGHNAILRMEPFMRHCGLGPLPGRGGLAGDILSHDFVEAALMRRAGYEVWLAPALGGSWEQHPPNLIEELRRDRRWCQGNLQNARLIAEPGLAPAHRAMLAVGALSYLVAPVWLVFVALGSLGLPGSHANLWGLTLGLLILPRVLGVAVALANGAARGPGGAARLWRDAALELGLSALQAPVRMLAHTSFVLAALTGWRLEWKSPAREATALAWRDAFAAVGSLALPALVATLLMSRGRALLDWRALPWLLPLLLAVPLAVVGGQPLAAARGPGTPPGSAVRRWSRLHSLLALGALMLAAMLLPRPALGPGLPAGWRVPAEFSLLSGSSPDGMEAAPAAAEPPARRTRAVRARPARMIDDAVRQRAAEYVAQSAGLDG